ncbi:hypothetical protein AB3D14_004581 [Vibrio alginolyticus]|uniref:hypothetical protein n=1 Tax=Vibrio alginolyticus TaxID=663 RepID=UPI00215D2004|nr:hypothetical protein [Vibrio alginolyticus]MCR9326045.1 hypothetical protein [Vibrio alginolyticus]MCR9357412.1 hypothetical protein [Vibrio alginolyticus]MCR9527505.1 hypothetical protein [Vibrio alginolyticus]
MSDKWPHVVTLVSVIAATGSGIFTTWSNNNLKVEMENLKNTYLESSTKTSMEFESKKERCKSITLIAQNIAKTQTDVTLNLKVEKKHEVDANLWAAATYLNEKDKKEFLERYSQGASADDEFHYKLREDLVHIALKGLVLGSQECSR